ncbi:beta-lactamase family protein (plasmid) [Rhizobium leguminosarum bv. viciae]|nr:beta-lactamase family protein [Rhizobium leguminosarum bv. viciae]
MTEDLAPKTNSLPNSLASAIDVAIEDALAEGRIAGCVVLVAENGKLVYQRAAGHADRETGRQMQIETPFRFASVTKAFTTMATLKLIEAGRLLPEDKVTKYLPKFAPRLADSSIADIRISHLMTHTAALDYRSQQASDGPYARAGVSDGLDESRGSLDANLTRIASVPLDRAPGEGWRYSVATDVLGGVIEAVTGMTPNDAISAPGIGAATTERGVSLARRGSCRSLSRRQTGAGANGRRRRVAAALQRGDGCALRSGSDSRRDRRPSGGAGMAGRSRDVLTLLEAYRTGSFLGRRTP